MIDYDDYPFFANLCDVRVHLVKYLELFSLQNVHSINKNINPLIII